MKISVFGLGGFASKHSALGMGWNEWLANGVLGRSDGCLIEKRTAFSLKLILCL